MSAPIHTQSILACQAADSGAVDNATATATVAATGSVRHFMLGCAASYSAAVAAVKTITFKRGTTTLVVVSHDFTNGPATLTLPGPLHGDYNEAVSVELEASGTGGTTGRVFLFHFPS